MLSKATICTALGNRQCSLDDFALSDIRTVIVLTDIDAAWTEKLRSELKVDSDFFAKHCRSTSATWTSVLGATPTRTIQDIRRAYTVPAEAWHLDGIFDSATQRLDRHSSRTEWSPTLSTRMSLWRHDKLVLLLIDSTSGPLHLPVSLNRGGLIINDLGSAISEFFKHQWHLDALFAAISPATFCYLLAASTMQANVHILDGKVKRIGFKEIRRPTLLTYDDLYKARDGVEALRKQVSMILQWMPAEVELQLVALDHETQHIGSPTETLKGISTELGLLDKFIMESFTLLLSFASLSLSETGAKTSKQAQQLTVLAFIYVPLTFVTGIFGMNIYEINGSSVYAWVPVAALGVTLAVTGVLLGSSILVQKLRIPQWAHQGDSPLSLEKDSADRR